MIAACYVAKRFTAECAQRVGLGCYAVMGLGCYLMVLLVYQMYLRCCAKRNKGV